MQVREFQAEIRARLAAVKRKQNIAALLEGGALSVAVVLCMLLAVLLVEHAFRPGVGGRTLLILVFGGAAAGLFVWRLARPLGRLLGLLADEADARTARTVGKAFPGIRDRLLNALQLSAERDSTTLASHALIDAALDDVRNDIGTTDFTSLVSYAASRRRARLVGVALASALLLVLFFPSTFFGAAHRLVHFGETFAPPEPFRFVVEPGDREVVKGENVPLLIRAEGAQPTEITLALRPQGQVSDDERTLVPGPDGVFRYECAALKTTTQYGVRADGVESRRFTLSVIDRPVVRLLRLHLVPPPYARLQGQQLEDNAGDVTALRGTTVEFALEANKDLRDARMIFSDSSVVPLLVAGRKATVSMHLMKELTYHLLLHDSAGTSSADPVEYALHAIPDAPPMVSIVVPGMNLDVTDNTSLSLMIKVSDDFGYSRLRLGYKLVQSKYEKPAEAFSYLQLPLPPQGGGEALVPYVWNIADLHLVPEDVISYFAEVFDNDAVAGPKSAMSEVYSLRLPSLDEVFADADKKHEAGIAQMSEALRQAQDARKELEELQQSLKSNKEKLDWQDRTKTEELLKKYEEVHSRMGDVSHSIEQMTADLQKNQVLSKETVQKYEELQHLMQQLSSPEFADAMKKLQEAMHQLSPEALKQALQQFNFSEESFRQSIERTLNLLKRIQIEQKVDEMVRRSEQLGKQQEDLRQRTSKADPQERKAMQDLAREQRELARQEDELQRALEALRKKMEEFPTEMPLAEMQQAQEDLHNSGIDSLMEDAARNLDQMQQQRAAAGQQQVMQKMRRSAQQLQAMQQALQQNQQRQIVNEMRRAMQDMLDLSGRQEELKKETLGLEQNSQRFRENAQGQSEVMRDLSGITERLSTLSQKTFGITPEMGRSIGKALRSMSEAMQSLEQRNRSAATQQQNEAMGSLNESAQQLQEAMQAMMEGGGQGMGMAGLMQRLQRMSAQQQGINDATGEQGGMSAEQAAGMARLAAEQGMVRKSLEQLTREAAASGELSKMLGDLTKIAQEMREVQTDLAGSNVTPETRRKQDRILSRLLDAQRSAQERDFEQRRTSTSGRTPVRPGPGEIDLTTQEGRNRLRRDLQKALEEGYARDYEDVIRKYFEVLEQYDQRTR
jgi:hypothetical protein